jgi:hypothetical protein
VKVGDELRHSRYHGGRWEGFVPVDGGRFRSDPVVKVGKDNGLVEVYGAGLDGQLARNVWRVDSSSWKGWEDLGKPAPGISGTAAVQVLEWWTDIRYVVVKSTDNRAYLSYSGGDGINWIPWEQGGKLGLGQFRGDVATFIGFERDRGVDLVLVGRSMESELASISLSIFDF